MHPWLLALLIAALLALGWLIYHLRHVRRAVDSILEKTPGIAPAEREQIRDRAHAAMDEARSAHGRIDRIDDDLIGDRRERGAIRAMIDTVKGRLTFLMHRDISEEIKRQQREEAKPDDDDASKNGG